MSQLQGAVIWRQIRALALAQCPSQQDDGQLLHTFLAERDEAAFAALVQRHGAMVLAVCRSVLHDLHDAEDAFQAAFLVLARKAHTIRKHDSLGSWLHGVAYRLALKAKARSKRLAQLDDSALDAAAAGSVDDLTFRELRAILHEELNRLPEKYRAPLLLCYWEGMTRDEAAERLGVTSGAFKKCLERARSLLGSRLIGRGLMPSAAIVTAAFFDSSARAASSTLIKITAHAAVQFAAGHTVTGVTPTALALAQGAIRIMSITKWASTISAALLICGLGVGLSWGGYQAYRQLDAGAANPVALVEEPQAVAGEKQKAGKATDAEKLVGTWIFVGGSGAGEKLPDEFIAAARMVFTKEGKMAIKILDGEKGGSFKVVEPGKLDLTTPDDTGKAIYKFDGNDKLTLCFRERDGDRPTEFNATKDNRQVLFVLRRAKPGEEKPPANAGGEKIREATARAISANQLKQIGLAFHNYYAVYKELPGPIYSKDGKTALLSWRVAILPFVEHEALYKEFKLDEPWDSAHNKKLIEKMPKIYEPVLNAKKGAHATHYQIITGPNTLFDGNKRLKLEDITDGTSNTLLAVEAKDPVVWTRPAELVMPKDADKLPAMGGMFSNGFHVLMCDGFVRMVPLNIAPNVFRPLVTPRAGD